MFFPSEIFKHKISHEQRSNTSLFFYAAPSKAGHWSETSRRVLAARICVCHQRETSAEHAEKQQQAQSSVLQQGKLFPSQKSRTELSASSGLVLQVFFVFFPSTIMILSCVHKHTSPKCFPSRAGSRFHLHLICFLLSFTLFFCSTMVWKMFQ